MSTTTLGVGIIGCGNISQTYFTAAKTFPILKIVSCADLNHEAATAKAEEHGCQGQSVDDLLANPAVDLVINLTIPAVHAEVSMQALRAGKHVHSEKPLAIELADGQAILDLAQKQGLLVGCAPDTFLGAGLQTCRKIIDDGWIGDIIGGSACMMCGGPDSWHPNPGFLFAKGAGPLFDMGPYYITALVHLLGPVKSVSTYCSRAYDERMATGKQTFGQIIQVEVPTHYTGTLEFHNGATVSFCMSFDVQAHSHPPLELYGKRGSLKIPDPNCFGGPVSLWTKGTKGWETQALSHPYSGNMRSLGAADMAAAILGKRPHRASGALALHTLEAMHAFEASAQGRRQIDITSKPAQPAAFPLGLVEGLVD